MASVVVIAIHSLAIGVVAGVLPEAVFLLEDRQAREVHSSAGEDGRERTR